MRRFQAGRGAGARGRLCESLQGSALRVASGLAPGVAPGSALGVTQGGLRESPQDPPSGRRRGEQAIDRSGGDRRRDGRPRARQRLPVRAGRVRHRPARGEARRHRRCTRAFRRRHRAAVRLPARRDELGGHRRGRRHRRRQRGGGEQAAPGDRRGAARRGQARAVREAARPVRGRRPGHGGPGREVRPCSRGRLHLPPVAGHQRDPRADHRRQPRPGRALQRALLVRLRLQPRCPDELALPGRRRVGGAGGHRHPPGRHRRIPVRPGGERARRGPEDHDPDRPVPLGTAVGHAGGVPVSDVREPVENEDIATFTAASPAARPGRSRCPGSPTACRTRSASRCSANAVRPRSTSTGPRSSRSPTRRRPGR